MFKSSGSKSTVFKATVIKPTDFKPIIGWDIGGAHLKAVLLDAKGNILNMQQLPCPLWRGLHELESAMQHMLKIFEIDACSALHAITMTGELVDCFADRDEGVCAIAQLTSNMLGENVRYYAANNGAESDFVVHKDVKRFTTCIASTNWHASASALAMRAQDALLIDIGSTTTDIIPIKNGVVALAALCDAARLQNDTLVYTGVVRTPVMVLAQKLPFEGAEINVMAEYFATMADVYRLTGELDAACDMAETADGKGKTQIESARRLARMVGCDVDQSLEKWILLANACRSLQIIQIKCAVMKYLKPDKPIIGAGAGAFLVRAIAAELNHPYLALAEVLPKIEANNAAQANTTQVEVCLPAYAVAFLAYNKQVFNLN